jgi:hypothetical protein
LSDEQKKCEHPDPRPIGDGKWCRYCGALYTEPNKFFKAMGFSGWSHPANDESVPTILNIAREVREKKERSVKQVGELPIPPPVYGEKEVREVLRVWEKPDGLVVYHRVGAWDDPMPWAFVLADIVRNVSRAYVDVGKLVRKNDVGNEGTVTQEHIEERILKYFEAEMEHPTAIPTRTDFDA